MKNYIIPKYALESLIALTEKEHASISEVRQRLLGMKLTALTVDEEEEEKVEPCEHEWDTINAPEGTGSVYTYTKNRARKHVCIKCGRKEAWKM